MPRIALNRLRDPLGVRALVAAALSLVALVGGGGAQGAPGTKGAAPVPSLAVPTLKSMARAGMSQDFTAVQVRRFRDDQGNVTSVREQLQVDADGSSEPRQVVTFLGVEGELPGSPVFVKWQQTYQRFGPQITRYGTFRVRDLANAEANYSLHDFGPVVRAGCAARRMVVFPRALDKVVWVVDVDIQTSVVLYTAEFDDQLRLLAEVEAQSFVPVASLPPTSGSGVTACPDYASACVALGNPGGLIEPDLQATTEYQLERIEVRDDPLSGQRRLVMNYTDGVDQFVVVQSPGEPSAFAGLTGIASPGHVIARYRDPALSVLLFWENGTTFQVAGRGSLRRLDQFARDLYVQALSAN